MSVGPVFKAFSLLPLLMAAALTLTPRQVNAETLEIGIGIQNTTTNTVTGGAVLKELGLFEKHLPTTGKYKDFKYSLSWQNATSGPPITNGMMANNIQIGMMGDYPLMVNGATGQATGNETQLVAIIAYNTQGSGNGIVVHKDSPYFELADLKGKNVSVPFGSAAHGMMQRALEQKGLPADFWNLVSQSPEIGSTNLQEKRIDVMEANDWMRKNPKLGAEKVEEWTKINKEVVYIFLGPGGIHTLDPTIKPAWVEAVKANYAVLKKLNMIKDLNVGAWVNDSYVRQAFKDLGLDYDKQLASQPSYDVSGNDPVCNVPVSNPREAGEVWIAGGEIVPFSSPVCTLMGVKKFTDGGKKLNAVYLVDHELGIKVFADAAFYSVGGKAPKKPEVVPFMLKHDAETYASKNGGKLASYSEALGAINVSQ